MLRHVGRNNPLVLVFAGMCCSIVAMHHDGPGLCFGLFLGAMLITKERIPHALLGVLLGFMAFTMGPGWEDIAEESTRSREKWIEPNMPMVCSVSFLGMSTSTAGA